MGWVTNGTPDTLGIAGDQLNLTDMNPFEFQVFLEHSLQVGGTTFGKGFTGGGSIDTGPNYTTRRAADGGGDSTVINQSQMEIHSFSNGDDFVFGYMINFSNKEKLMMFWEANQNGAGAGTAPSRQVSVHKYVETTLQVNHFRFLNDGAGSYDVNSNLSSIGTD